MSNFSRGKLLAIAAMEQDRKMGEWRPMETAPKDSTSVLLNVRGVCVQAHWGVDRDGDYNRPCWVPDHTGAILQSDVQAWMPLPEPLE